jgi:hypothetical protein
MEWQNKIPRENVVMITKILCLVGGDPASRVAFDPSMSNTRTYVNQGGLFRTAIFNQVDASLARLQTTYLDVLMIHAADPTTPFEETMRALHDLVVAGKAWYLGASNLRAWQLAEMNHIAEMKGWTQFICMEVEHSLVYRSEVIFSISFLSDIYNLSRASHRKRKPLRIAITRGLESSRTLRFSRVISHGLWELRACAPNMRASLRRLSGIRTRKLSSALRNSLRNTL